MDTPPLKREAGAVLILDQRALPAEERWLRCERPGEVAEAIRSLAVRGAPAIGLAAAYAVALAPTGAERCAEEVRAGFEDAAAELASTRPTAVNLAWALDRQREALDAALGSGADPVAALVERADALAHEAGEGERRLARLGAERFARGDRALTHCNTGPLATGGFGTAAGVLRQAWEDERLAEVWVCETRPLLQGARLTAWELGRAGIPHRLVTDSSAGALMARGLVDRVVVGADRIAANGDVANKVGTYPLAVLADRHQRALLRGGAAVDRRPRHAQRRGDPDRGARPRGGHRPRGSAHGRPRVRRIQHGLRRDARRADHGDLHRGRSARAAVGEGDCGCHRLT